MPNIDKNLILELSEEEKTEHLDEAIQAFILCLTKSNCLYTFILLNNLLS